MLAEFDLKLFLKQLTVQAAELAARVFIEIAKTSRIPGVVCRFSHHTHNFDVSAKIPSLMEGSNAPDEDYDAVLRGEKKGELHIMQDEQDFENITCTPEMLNEKFDLKREKEIENHGVTPLSENEIKQFEKIYR